MGLLAVLGRLEVMPKRCPLKGVLPQSEGRDRYGKEAPRILNALAYSREGEDKSSVTNTGWHGSRLGGKGSRQG